MIVYFCGSQNILPASAAPEAFIMVETRFLIRVTGVMGVLRGWFGVWSLREHWVVKRQQREHQSALITELSAKGGSVLMNYTAKEMRQNPHTHVLTHAQAFITHSLTVTLACAHPHSLLVMQIG